MSKPPPQVKHIKLTIYQHPNIMKTLLRVKRKSGKAKSRQVAEALHLYYLQFYKDIYLPIAGRDVEDVLRDTLYPPGEKPKYRRGCLS